MTGAAGARIALIIDGALEQRTGGYLYDRIVAERLRVDGVEVRIVSLPTTGGARATLAAHRAVYEAIARGHDDVVVVDELCHPRAAAAAVAARAIRRSGRPRVVTLVHHLAASERTGTARAARLVVERALLAASDRVVATSATTADLLADLGVPRGALFVARPGRDRLGERASPPPPSGAARFLFLGALTPRKDPLAALAALAAAGSSATLTLIGPADRDPACAAAVRRAAAGLGGRAVVAGELDDDAVTRALATHDVLIMPSRHEGYGIAAAEALAHGLLVIATRAGALPEVVRDDHGGVLVPPGDTAALAAAVRRAASDRPWLAAQQRLALEHARTLPTWADATRAFAHAVLD